ncbi:MAG: hypothetical protein RLN76_00550 [Phycisphaeraceae bacterium]
MNKMTFGMSIVAGLAVAGNAWAAGQNYGSFVGANVTYTDVTENSTTDPLPLFGAPTVVGDTMSFSPNNYESFANAGVPADITDSQLSFTLSTNDNDTSLTMFELTETGDYTLIGPPGSFAQAVISTPVFFDITGVDGVEVDGPSGSFNMVIVPASGNFLLPGTGGVITGVIWSGSIQIDLLGALAGTEFEGQGVTEAYITIDNVLASAAAGGASSFIKKKETDGVVIEITTIDRGDIPEPATATLLALGLAAIARRS